MKAILLIAVLVCLGVDAFASAPYKEDIVIFRDPDKYSCFPGLTLGESDALWVGFGWNTNRSHYGKIRGGETGSELFYSPDAGKSWIHSGSPNYVPRPDSYSTHDLGGGVRALAWGIGHEVLTDEQVKVLQPKGVSIIDHKNGNRTACYRASAKRSTDGGKTWKHWDLELPPLKFLMGSHDPKGVVCDDGTVLSPIYGQYLDDPVGRAFVLRSVDKGESWQLMSLGYDGVHAFNETSIVQIADGKVIAQMRSEPGQGSAPAWEKGFVYQAESLDRGATWSAPVRLPIWGYPQNLIRLKDGTLLSTYGYRRPPYGIRACFSYDNGKTWDWKNEVILRDDALPAGPESGKTSAGDLGYPHSVELSDGGLFTVYYFTKGDGVTHVAATRWSRDYKGTPDLPRGEDAIAKPNPIHSE